MKSKANARTARGLFAIVKTKEPRDVSTGWVLRGRPIEVGPDVAERPRVGEPRTGLPAITREFRRVGRTTVTYVT